MAFLDYLNPVKGFKRFNSAAGQFLKGTPDVDQQRSTLRSEQQPLFDQLQAANQGPGAGGSFGASADYYRDLLDPNSQNFQQMANPEMRQFNEQTIPGLAEQFAGLGAGGSGLSSSGFRNAAVNAGSDLAERLGAIRAQLRQQGASGLQNMGQFGLQPFAENITRPGRPGFLEQAAPVVGTALGAFAGPIGAAAGNAAGTGLSNWLNTSKKGTASPYGDNNQNMRSSAF